jgi:hypothetical protein
MQTIKNSLTSSDDIRTIVHRQDIGENEMDATTKTLLAKLHELERQKWAIGRDIDAINRTLALAGVKPPTGTTRNHEIQYVVNQPFAKLLLTDACLSVLRDYGPQWLSVAEVEFLIARGGYPFATADAKNSVSVSLRRLAEQGKCEVERVRGSHGNRYRKLQEGDGNAVEDSRATNG